jgi:hypothetical protein
MDADPVCAYQPRGDAVITPLADAAASPMAWDAAAEQRLARVPTFLRALVKKRAEAYVAGLGEEMVTREHLSQLAARRFGGATPRVPDRVKDSGLPGDGR